MNIIKTTFLAGLLSAFSASALLAQSTGSLRGQVTDPSGAGIPGATITLSGPANLVKVASSDSSGNYIIPGLPGGMFTVRAAAPGFNLFEKTNLELNVGRGATLDIPMTVAVEKQEVTVADTQGISIDPEKNAGAIVLKGEDLDFLSDDPCDLEADLLALAGPAVGPNGGQIYIDGFSSGQLPPKENIREIRINSNPFSAEYDQPGFGRIEIFTKPGTDKFRGNVLLNDMDSLFNSRNPFSDTSKPSYSQKQAQTNWTGPLGHKTSWNFEFDYRKQDFVSLIQAKDPTQFPDSLAGILSPSFLGTSINSWYPNYQTRYSFSPRMDYQLTKNITLSGRYTFTHTDSPNSGIGGVNLADFYSPTLGPLGVLANQETINTGYQSTAQLTETQVIGARAVNESRFQYHHTESNSAWDNTLGSVSPENTACPAAITNCPPPQINAGNTFSFGGPAAALTYTHQTNYEYWNLTSLTRNKHFIKFGVRIRGAEETLYSPNNFNGTFQFGGVSCTTLPATVAANNPLCAANPGGLISALQSYAATTLLLSQGLPMATIRSQYGVGPTYYTIAGGQPLLNVSQIDAAPFIQDDWRIVPSMTLSLGMRYEVQNNINNKGAWAPRAALSWGIGGGQGKGRNPKTVLRLGYGVFYDRVNLGLTLAALRENGVTQQNYQLFNPNTYPLAPAASSLTAESQLIQKLDSNIQAPQMLQSAIGVDRQVTKSITLSVNFIDTRGNHAMRDVNINTPVPGTYIPSDPSAAVYPLASVVNPVTDQPYGSGIVDLYESSGLWKQWQLQFSPRVQLSNRINLFGYYVYGQAHGNADGGNGGGTFPANPYNFAEDWGRTAFDIRQRFQVGGSVTAPWKVTLSPNLNYSTAPPLNITTGDDIYGDGQLNARPAFATVPANPAIGVIATPWGVFNTNPTQNPQYGSQIIPRNYASAYGNFRFNLRIGRTWGFGERVAAGGNQQQGQNQRNPNFNPNDQGGGGGRGGGGRGGGFAGGGRGGGGRGGGNQSSGQRYTLNANIEFQNVFNTVNKPAPIANLSSPYLGEILAGTGQNALWNRRVQLVMRFSF